MSRVSGVVNCLYTSSTTKALDRSLEYLPHQELGCLRLQLGSIIIYRGDLVVVMVTECCHGIVGAPSKRLHVQRYKDEVPLSLSLSLLDHDHDLAVGYWSCPRLHYPSASRLLPPPTSSNPSTPQAGLVDIRIAGSIFSFFPSVILIYFNV